MSTQTTQTSKRMTFQNEADEIKRNHDSRSDSKLDEKIRSYDPTPKIISTNALPGFVNEQQVFKGPDQIIVHLKEKIRQQVRDNVNSMWGNANSRNFTGRPAKRIPLFFWGAPGIGKTSIVKQAIHELSNDPNFNMNIIHVDMSKVRPEDLVIPEVDMQPGEVMTWDDDKNTFTGEYRKAGSILPEWMPAYEPESYSGNPEDIELAYNTNRKLDALYNAGLIYKNNRKAFRRIFPEFKNPMELVNDESVDYTDVDHRLRERGCKNGNVIFFDEYSRVDNPALYNIMMNFCLEGMYGNKILASHTAIVVASNRFEDIGGFEKSFMNTEGAAMTRFRPMMFVPDYNQWLRWAEGEIYPPLLDFVKAGGPRVWYDTVEFRSSDTWYKEHYPTMAQKCQAIMDKLIAKDADGAVNGGTMYSFGVEMFDERCDANKTVASHNPRSIQRVSDDVKGVINYNDIRQNDCFGNFVSGRPYKFKDIYTEGMLTGDERLAEKRKRWATWYFGEGGNDGVYKLIDPKQEEFGEMFSKFADGQLDELPEKMIEKVMLLYAKTQMFDFGAGVPKQFAEWIENGRYVDSDFALAVWNTGYPPQDKMIDFGHKIYNDDKEVRKEASLYDLDRVPGSKYFTREEIEKTKDRTDENCYEDVDNLRNYIEENKLTIGEGYLRDNQLPKAYEWKYTQRGILGAIRNILMYMPQEYKDDFNYGKLDLSEAGIKKYATQENYDKYRNEIAVYDMLCGPDCVMKGKIDLLFINIFQKPEWSDSKTKKEADRRGNAPDATIAILAQSKFARGLCRVFRYAIYCLMQYLPVNETQSIRYVMKNLMVDAFNLVKGDQFTQEDLSFVQNFRAITDDTVEVVNDRDSNGDVIAGKVIETNLGDTLPHWKSIFSSESERNNNYKLRKDYEDLPHDEFPNDIKRAFKFLPAVTVLNDKAFAVLAAQNIAKNRRRFSKQNTPETTQQEKSV